MVYVARCKILVISGWYSVLSVSGTSFDPRTLFTIPRSLQDVLDYTECGVFVNVNLYVLRIIF